MATFTVVIDGVPTPVPVPDGLSKGGAQDWLIQSGFEPADVGVDLPEADPIPLGMQALIGAGQTASDLFETLQSPIRAPEGAASQIGQGVAFAPTLLAPTARLTGAAIQGAISGGLSLARQNAAGQGIDPREAGREAAFTAGLQSVFNGVGRVMNGISRRINARARRDPISLPRRPGPSQEAERFAENIGGFVRGSGALRGIETAQRRANNFAWGKAMGFPTRDARRIANLDAETLGRARAIIDRGYDAAAPTQAVPIGAVDDILKELKASGLPDSGVNNLLRLFKGKKDGMIDPSEWQGVQRTLRDVAARVRRNPTFSGLSDDITKAIDELDQAAIAAGGDLDILRQANHRYKLLANTEELTDLMLTGQIPLGSELLRKLTRESFKGFGRRGTLEGTLKVDPDMQRFIDVQREVAKFAKETAGGSPTAGRLASQGAATQAGIAALSGEMSSGQAAMKIMLRLGLPPILAAAAIGEAGTQVLRGLGSTGAQAVPKALTDFDAGEGEPLSPAESIPKPVLDELRRREAADEGIR